MRAKKVLIFSRGHWFFAKVVSARSYGRFIYRKSFKTFDRMVGCTLFFGKLDNNLIIIIIYVGLGCIFQRVSNKSQKK